MNNVSEQRLVHIDAIRGMAALAVVIFHAIPWFPTGLLRQVGDFLDLGKFGVALFFMVSGFVVPFSLMGGKASGLRIFAIRRWFRLYPAYWLSLTGAVIMAAVLGQAIPMRDLAINLTMLQGFVRVPDVLPVFWTLQIELIFYGLCALVFWSGRLRSIRVLLSLSLFWLALGVAMAWLRWHLNIKLPVAVPLALALMFSGTLWRHHLLENNVAAKFASNLSFTAFLVLLPVICLLAYNRDYGFGETWYRYTVSYGLAVAAFLLFTTRWKIRNRIAVWLGTISYSVYLLHGIVLMLYSRLVQPQSSIPLHIALYVMITLVLSQIVYAGLEMPAIRLGRALTDHRSRGKEAVI